MRKIEDFGKSSRNFPDFFVFEICGKFLVKLWKINFLENLCFSGNLEEIFELKFSYRNSSFGFLEISARFRQIFDKFILYSKTRQNFQRFLAGKFLEKPSTFKVFHWRKFFFGNSSKNSPKFKEIHRNSPILEQKKVIFWSAWKIRASKLPEHREISANSAKFSPKIEKNSEKFGKSFRKFYSYEEKW